jgi:hypothetical protein
LIAILEAEKRYVEGRGYAVPHRIRLKLQWNKFSDDVEGEIKKLREELTVAALDFINDNLYVTVGPLDVDVAHDYFVQGIKFLVSFDDLSATDTSAASSTITFDTGTVSKLPKSQSGGSPKHTDEGICMSYRYQIDDKQFADSLHAKAGERIKVGRDASNDIVINHPSVSKFHCTILVGENGELKIADTGSTNGTIVDGSRIEYGRTITKDSFCKVRVGDIEVDFDTDDLSTGSAGPAECIDDNI